MRNIRQRRAGLLLSGLNKSIAPTRRDEAPGAVYHVGQEVYLSRNACGTIMSITGKYYAIDIGTGQIRMFTANQFQAVKAISPSPIKENHHGQKAEQRLQ